MCMHACISLTHTYIHLWRLKEGSIWWYTDIWTCMIQMNKELIPRLRSSGVWAYEQITVCSENSIYECHWSYQTIIHGGLVSVRNHSVPRFGSHGIVNWNVRSAKSESVTISRLRLTHSWSKMDRYGGIRLDCLGTESVLVHHTGSERNTKVFL